MTNRISRKANWDLLLRDVGAVTRVFEPAEERVVPHRVFQIRFVFALVSVVAWVFPAVPTTLLFEFVREWNTYNSNTCEFAAERVLGEPLPQRPPRPD